MRRYIHIFLLCLLLGAPSLSEAAPSFVFTPIDAPGSSFTRVSGINDRGEVVGGYIDANGVSHGFAIVGSAFSTIDVPGASGAGATAINNGGTIVGIATGLGAFIESGGVFSIFLQPSAFTTQFYGINSAGDVVGLNSDPSGVRGLFRDSTGTTTLLDVPGAKRTDAFGINDCGQIVGDFQDTSGTFHGFLNNHRALSVINVPFAGVTQTSAIAIDNAGRILGTFHDAGGYHAFLKIGGTFTVIDVPFAGATDTNAFGLNNNGQIVGWYTDASGSTRGFLATPTASLPAPPFEITAVTPSRGGNTGVVTARLFTVGCGLQAGATATLRRAGEADIVGTAVVTQGAALTTTWDLTGRALGTWDVVVTNPDGTSAILSNGFSVEATQPPQAQPRFTFTPIDVPGSSFTRASGINDRGEIVGSYVGLFVSSTVSGTGHGFVTLGNTSSIIETIDVPGAQAQPSAINNSGTIVGAGAGGFIESGGHFSFVQLGGTAFFGINNAGNVVGINSDGLGVHGLLRDSTGTLAIVDLPGAARTDILGINDGGQVVGQFLDATGRTFHGFLSQDTTGPSHGFQPSGNALSVIDVPFAGVTLQSANAIDNAGRIVGSFLDARGWHGFLKIGSTFTVIDVPFAGATDTMAFGLNNYGQIVGQYTDAAGTTRGFLATPTVPIRAPAPIAIAPNRGGNAGTVTLSIFGSVIPAGSTAKLVCSGQPNILATVNTISANGSVLSATFDLTGAIPGQCNAVITQPDGNSLTVAEPFTIEQGGAPRIWVDIIGRNQVRAGRPQMFYVVYGNSGNVDSIDPFTLFVAFPNSLSSSLDSGQPLTGAFQTGATTILALPASFIPPGTNLVIPIQLTAPNNSAPFELTVWTNLP